MCSMKELGQESLQTVNLRRSCAKSMRSGLVECKIRSDNKYKKGELQEKEKVISRSEVIFTEKELFEESSGLIKKLPEESINRKTPKATASSP